MTYVLAPMAGERGQKLTKGCPLNLTRIKAKS